MSRLALTIRPATSADKPAVLRFCAQTWPDGDYIPAVWDDWLADPASTLLVGLADDEPVAVAHVSVHGAAGWFEGLRVAPSYRGQGGGRQMLEASSAEVRRRGGRVLRLLTERSNAPMAALLPRLGFRVRFEALWLQAPALPGPAPIPTETPIDALLADAGGAAMLEDTGGLYADGWSFVDLTAEQLTRHRAAGEIVAAPGGAGWAIVMPDGESERMAVALAVGRAAEVLRAMRSHPAALRQGAIRTFVPAGGAAEQAARAAGYAPQPHRFGVYEQIL